MRKFWIICVVLMVALFGFMSCNPDMDDNGNGGGYTFPESVWGNYSKGINDVIRVGITNGQGTAARFIYSNASMSFNLTNNESPYILTGHGVTFTATFDGNNLIVSGSGNEISDFLDGTWTRP